MTDTTADSQLWVQKDPATDTPFSFDLAQFVGAGNVLSAASWSITPSDATVSNPTIDGSVATITIAGGVPLSWYVATCDWAAAAAGQSGKFTVAVFITEPVTQQVFGSAVFPNRFEAVAKLRTDRLLLAAAGSLPGVTLSDDYLWGKLRAAESEIAHTLRVPLQPTRFFPYSPTPAMLATAGRMPWDIDPGYDYASDFFQGDAWGFMRLRNKPLITVNSVRFAYPTTDSNLYEIPLEWLRLESKYSQLQFIPATTNFTSPLTSFIVQAMGAGRTIPFMIQVDYVAGISDVRNQYPELVDVVQKLAVLKVLEDSFFPQSGSISADGLSQSMSNDMSKHQDAIDNVINGPKGSNGGLMAAIHGVRMGFVG
jgi:hypothetical protein